MTACTHPGCSNDGTFLATVAGNPATVCRLHYRPAKVAVDFPVTPKEPLMPVPASLPPPPSPDHAERLRSAVADVRAGKPGGCAGAGRRFGLTDQEVAAECDRLGIARMRSGRPVDGKNPQRTAAAVDAVRRGAGIRVAAKAHRVNEPHLRAALLAAGVATRAQRASGMVLSAPVASPPFVAAAAQSTLTVPASVEWDGAAVMLRVLGRRFALARVTVPVAGPIVAELYDWGGEDDHVDIPCRSEAEAVAVVTAMLAIRGVHCPVRA
jgi:hypothetical protein